MILSRKWANDYVDLTDIDNKTFCDEMTLSGSKVEIGRASCRERV